MENNWKIRQYLLFDLDFMNWYENALKNSILFLTPYTAQEMANYIANYYQHFGSYYDLSWYQTGDLKYLLENPQFMTPVLKAGLTGYYYPGKNYPYLEANNIKLSLSKKCTITATREGEIVNFGDAKLQARYSNHCFTIEELYAYLKARNDNRLKSSELETCIISHHNVIEMRRHVFSAVAIQLLNMDYRTNFVIKNEEQAKKMIASPNWSSSFDRPPTIKKISPEMRKALFELFNNDIEYLFHEKKFSKDEIEQKIRRFER